jgi:HK97 family phage major capsid protein
MENEKEKDITEEVEPEDEQLVYFGDTVKALGDGKLGGYLVRFSSDDDTDLEGDFFNKDTDYGDATKSAVYYNHGMDPVIKRRKLGSAELTTDDIGIWAEAQLNMRDEYEKFIYGMAEAGKQGWSSGTASHLVEKEKSGKATWIRSWPLGLDASLTPTPAEPRNGVQPLKSIKVEPLMESEPMDDLVEESTDQDGSAEPEAEDQTKMKDINEEITMEITEERLQELINGAVESGVEKAMKALPAISDDVKPEVKVIKDEADRPFETDGEFFQAVKNAAYYPQSQDVRLNSLKATGLSENVPADGGYLLQPQVSGGIIERMYNTGQIIGRVASDTIGPNSNSMLYNAVDETSRADGSRFGGVRGYWLAEAADKTASKPKFRQMELKLKKVAALCYATDELLGDAVALESWLARTVPEELRFQVENAFYNGNGVGRPLGIMNSPCLVSPLRAGANLVDQTDIATLWSRRWPAFNDYVWLINTTVWPQLVNLTLGNFPLVLPMNSGIQGDPGGFSIYGRPVLEVEYAAALGTTGDIMLASLGQYQTINKGGVQAASSIHVSFAADETVFRFVYRIDGQPLWNSALTPYAGSTLSPFVVLAAASV